MPRWHYPFKMCRDPRHTSVFHAPEGVLHTPEGVLHVPKARLIAELCSAYSLLQPFGTKKSL